MRDIEHIENSPEMIANKAHFFIKLRKLKNVSRKKFIQMAKKEGLTKKYIEYLLSVFYKKR